MNTKTLIAMTAVAAASQATFDQDILSEADFKFMEFVSTQGKSYGTKAEFQFRSKIFKQNFEEIEKFNNSNSTSRMGINFLADRTADEKKQLMGYLAGERKNKTYVTPSVEDIPTAWDWREHNAVTPVKNQGQCGSCWSFSATGAVEGARAIATGKLEAYSEQQLVDCSSANHACNGGWMDNAFEYIENNHPLRTEANYPYHAKKGFCNILKRRGDGVITSHVDVTPNDPNALRAALALAPVSVAVEADASVFQMYTSGVVTDRSCGKSLNHGVLAVGYGTLGGQDFILVKNSWGASWGDNGYIRISAGVANICGVLSAPSYVQV